ncbi:PREDICTED: uncharacterized protein LOC101806510 [Ficedula albicollis]|uniref:uncharacterized protein LOC101806510 n=1 Tax=Ficedula albicollis TaxID=59894 RepID=UPI0007AD8644|nr:PREDICTED: uncharacterized protein LOC101806510 [Ficedula albicollis]
MSSCTSQADNGADATGRITAALGGGSAALHPLGWEGSDPLVCPQVPSSLLASTKTTASDELSLNTGRVKGESLGMVYLRLSALKPPGGGAARPELPPAQPPLLIQSPPVRGRAAIPRGSQAAGAMRDPLLWASCLLATGCLGGCRQRCCPGRNNACRAPCYCHSYCQRTGDCCQDYLAMCRRAVEWRRGRPWGPRLGTLPVLLPSVASVCCYLLAPYFERGQGRGGLLGHSSPCPPCPLCRISPALLLPLLMTLKLSFPSPPSVAAVGCAVEPWGPWSGCSCRCGAGSRARSPQAPAQSRDPLLHPPVFMASLHPPHSGPFCFPQPLLFSLLQTTAFCMPDRTIILPTLQNRIPVHPQSHYPSHLSNRSPSATSPNAHPLYTPILQKNHHNLCPTFQPPFPLFSPPVSPLPSSPLRSSCGCFCLTQVGAPCRGRAWSRGLQRHGQACVQCWGNLSHRRPHCTGHGLQGARTFWVAASVVGCQGSWVQEGLCLLPTSSHLRVGSPWEGLLLTIGASSLCFPLNILLKNGKTFLIKTKNKGIAKVW